MMRGSFDSAGDHRAGWRRVICLNVAMAVAVVVSITRPAYGQEERDVADLSIEELSDLLVTTVSRRPESLAHAASAVQVITAEDIRRSGATRLPEVLRLASNLQVAQISSDGWAVSSRGFNSALANKLLVMIDGRTIYSPLFAGTFWEAHDLPIYDIDRIEVVSGPGATLWGANAVNGVINVVTRDARDTQGLLVRAAGGDELRAVASARYGGKLGPDAHYRIHAQYADRDGTLLETGADAANASNRGSAGLRVDWDLSSADALTVSVAASESETEQPGFPEATSRMQSAFGRWVHRFSDDSDLQVRAYFDRAVRRSQPAYADRLDTWDLELQHHFRPFSAHEVIWGLTLRRIDDEFDNQFFAMDPAATTLERFGGFVQDRITLTEEWQLTLGTKLEDNEYTGVEWQPSVRVAWNLRPEAVLWAAASRALRSPSRIDRDLDNGTSPPFTVGSDTFESEEVQAYELGVRVQPAVNLAVALATYYNVYDDIRSFEPVAPPVPVPLRVGNGLKGDGYGAELTLDYRPQTWCRLWGGFTYGQLDLDRKPGSLDPIGGAVEARDWDHQLFVRGSLDLPASLELDASVRNVGGIDDFDMPAYTELDVRLGWRPRAELELALVVSNLLNDSHGEFGPPGRLEIERSAYVQVTWTP